MRVNKIIFLMMTIALFSFNAFSFDIKTTQPGIRHLELKTGAGTTAINNFTKHVTVSSTTDVNISSDLFTSTDHPFAVGDKVRVTTSSDLPTGLDQDTDYYIIDSSDDTFKLASSRNYAVVGTPVVDITAVGTGVQTISLVEFKISDHGLTTGERVQVDSAASTNSANVNASAVSTTADTFTSAGHGFISGDIVQVSTSATMPTGISALTDYYIVKSTDDVFYLASTLDNAIVGTPVVDITAAGNGIHTVSESATIPTGLATSTDYWVSKTDRNRFDLVTSFGGSTVVEWTDVSSETAAKGKLILKRTDEFTGLAKSQLTITASTTGTYKIVPKYQFASDDQIAVIASPITSNCRIEIPTQEQDLIVVKTYTAATTSETLKDCYFSGLILGSDLVDFY